MEDEYQAPFIEVEHELVRIVSGALEAEDFGALSDAKGLYEEAEGLLKDCLLTFEKDEVHSRVLTLVAQTLKDRIAVLSSRVVAKPKVISSKDDELSELIKRDIMDPPDESSRIEISGLDEEKALLSEIFLLPSILPSLCSGIRRPPKGVLLFGPPGTGKTVLARFVAWKFHTTFFNVSMSTIASKWYGDSEKLVRTLFTLARDHAPSTICFDEVDALCGVRGGEQESSRRLKAELLVQMDGIGSRNDRIICLAATNCPWDVDDAFLRRLEQHLYIPLPSECRRVEILGSAFLGTAVSADFDVSTYARLLQGHSCADIISVCHDASMQPIRREMRGRSTEELAGVDQSKFVVRNDDMMDAIRRRKPSISQESVVRFEAWNSRATGE